MSGNVCKQLNKQEKTGNYFHLLFLTWSYGERNSKGNNKKKKKDRLNNKILIYRNKYLLPWNIPNQHPISFIIFIN